MLGTSMYPGVHQRIYIHRSTTGSGCLRRGDGSEPISMSGRSVAAVWREVAPTLS